MADADRHSRQARLREVGPAGQDALRRARLVIGTGPGATIELAYLERAGVGCVALDSRRVAPPFAHRSAFLHPEAAAFAGGAWRALRQIETALESSR